MKRIRIALIPHNLSKLARQQLAGTVNQTILSFHTSSRIRAFRRPHTAETLTILHTERVQITKLPLHKPPLSGTGRISTLLPLQILNSSKISTAKTLNSKNLLFDPRNFIIQTIEIEIELQFTRISSINLRSNPSDFITTIIRKTIEIKLQSTRCDPSDFVMLITKKMIEMELQLTQMFSKGKVMRII